MNTFLHFVHLYLAFPLCILSMCFLRLCVPGNVLSHNSHVTSPWLICGIFCGTSGSVSSVSTVSSSASSSSGSSSPPPSLSLPSNLLMFLISFLFCFNFLLFTLYFLFKSSYFFIKSSYSTSLATRVANLSDFTNTSVLSKLWNFLSISVWSTL